MESSGCKSRPAKASRQAVASVAIHRATGECGAYTTRKQAAKVQLRNTARCDADAVNEGGRQHPVDRHCEVAPGSPESLARGMLPKGFPRNPGELTISAHTSGNAAAKGDRRRPHTDG